jgi:hypothetical protein
MHRFERGSGTVSHTMTDEGIVEVRMSGLIVPSNAAALSALVLDVVSDQGATGVLSSLQPAMLALPPIDPRHYAYVPPGMRGVPVAVLVSPQQLHLYMDVAQAAAAAGTIRRAFLSREEAQDWLREQARALAANRVWRPGRRSPQ